MIVKIGFGGKMYDLEDLIAAAEGSTHSAKGATAKRKEVSRVFGDGIHGPSVRRLFLRDLSADIAIAPRNPTSGTTSVRITGPAELVDQVQMTQCGDKLILATPGEGRSGDNMVFIGGCKGITIRQNRIGGSILNIGSVIVDTPRLRIEIAAPTDSNIAVFNCNGKITIGDFSGDLETNLVTADMKVVSISNVRAQVSGSGDLHIDRVRGNVDLEITGSGDININGGEIDKLYARVTGSGDIVVDATVRDVSAFVTGSGDITVSRATGDVAKRVTGSGDIRINER